MHAILPTLTAPMIHLLDRTTSEKILLLTSQVLTSVLVTSSQPQPNTISVLLKTITRLPTSHTAVPLLLEALHHALLHTPAALPINGSSNGHGGDMNGIKSPPTSKRQLFDGGSGRGEGVDVADTTSHPAGGAAEALTVVTRLLSTLSSSTTPLPLLKHSLNACRTALQTVMSGEASAAPTAVREVVKALCVCLGGGGIEGSDGVVASEMAALLDGGCVASTPSTAAPEAKEAKKEEAEEEEEGSDWDDWDESDEELEKSSGGVDAAQAEVGALLW